jgi:hypothetical protein
MMPLLRPETLCEAGTESKIMLHGATLEEQITSQNRVATPFESGFPATIRKNICGQDLQARTCSCLSQPLSRP